MIKPLSRRAVLKGAGGVALSLPFLDAMLARGQSSPAFPNRFVGIFASDGFPTAGWVPVGSETSWTLPRLLTPLGSFQATPADAAVSLQNRVNVITNLNQEIGGPGSDHQKGVSCTYTGIELLNGNFSGCGGSCSAGFGGGISLDQHLVRELQPNTPVPSLQLGVQVASNDNRGRISYSGPNEPLAPDNDPSRVFSRLFSSFTPPAAPTGAPDPVAPTGPDPAILSRRALLGRQVTAFDAVKEEYDVLRRKLGAEDRQRLERHIDGIDAIYQRLHAEMAELDAAIAGGGTVATGGAVGSACAAPPAPPGGSLTDRGRIQEIGRLQMDLLVMGMACDITRIATLMMVDGDHYRSYPHLGFTGDHHNVAHSGNTAALEPIHLWQVQEFGYLVWKMSQIPEGDGTLLDHSFIVWMKELGNGESHSRKNIPTLTAGGAGGHQTGRFIQLATSHAQNDMLITAANYMGVPTTIFGNPSICKGALPGV